MSENTQNKILNTILVLTTILLIFLVTCIGILVFAPESSTSLAIETTAFALTGKI